MSSPLFLGNDPRFMSEEEKSIILNEVAISINQDPTEQGILIKKTGNSEIWRKKLTGGKYAVLLLNRDNTQPSDIELSLKELGITSGMNIYDIFEKKAFQGKKKTMRFSVKPHSCQFLLL
jgi:alpha-galactosidase